MFMPNRFAVLWLTCHHMLMKKGRWLVGATTESDVLVRKGFMVKKVHPVWRNRNFTGKILIEFGMSTAHRNSDLKLESVFRAQGCAKEVWVPPFENRTSPYLWVTLASDVDCFVTQMDPEVISDEVVRAIQEFEESDDEEVYMAILDAIVEIYPPDV
ncbi:hypothetical protein RND81_05G077900 [Saponaria officinalis]|uniref:XS domain-containing protein n=1 Tax=Saponaria officinalis TaxID=3572 RepID=A0AAW1KUC4_SAPOF